MGVGIVRFSLPMEVMSCAVLNGGIRTSTAFFIMQVPRDYDGADPEADAAAVRDVLGLPEDAVGMMTAAEVSHVFNIKEAESNGVAMCAVATAGLSNQVVAGDVLENYPERRAVSDRRAAELAGTINIALVSPVPLTEQGKVNMFMPLVEGKSAAMAGHGYRETGTTSDAMAVFSPAGGDRVTYTGTGSDIGIAAARAVRSAVGWAMEARGEHPVLEEPCRILRSMGYDTGRLMGLSGAQIDADRFEAILSDLLSQPRPRALLDLVLQCADRADSMAADGQPVQSMLLRKLAGSVLGIPVDDDGGIIEAVLTAVSRRVVIDDE